MENNEKRSLKLALRDILSREHKGIPAYTRLGIVSFYVILGGFTVLEKVYSAGAVLIFLGRCYAVAALVIFFALSTQESTRSELEAALNDGGDGSSSDLLWVRAAPLLFYAPLLAAAYCFYINDFWGCLLYSGYPAWRLWLMIELRLKLIATAVMHPWRGWRYVLVTCSIGAAAAIMLTMFTAGGPYQPMIFGIEVYQAAVIVCLAGVVLSYIAGGDDLFFPYG